MNEKCRCCLEPMNGSDHCPKCGCEEMEERPDCQDKDTWTTDELRRDFHVIAFLAPFVHVARRKDKVSGTLEFTHNPRLYFKWKEDL